MATPAVCFSISSTLGEKMNTRLNVLEKPIEILLVEDNPGDARLIKEVFKDSKFSINISNVQNGEDALAFLKQEGDFLKAPVPELILLDLNLPKKDGRELLADIKKNEAFKDIPTLILTGSNNDSDVRFAYESNANFYVVKPMGVEHFAALLRYLEDFLIKSLNQQNAENPDLGCHIVIKTEEEWDRATTELKKAKFDLDVDEGNGFMVRSPRMQTLMELVKTLAKVDSTVLITGESGTGKERIARYLHDYSSRASGPFIAVNCAAIAESLLESELFGHARGAFTGATADRKGFFEAANGGTLFLDEIGEISPGLQAKLLRVLQESQVRRVGENKPRDVDVRILSATNKDLLGEVAAKRFREDLMYRLRIIEVALPPLRDREEDILPLASTLIDQIAHRMIRPVKGFSPEVAEVLVHYDWPGNVRELENAMERAIVLAKGARIEVEDLPLEISSSKNHAGEKKKVNLLKDVERDVIMDALNKNDGNRIKASAALGMGVATLYRKLKIYRLEGNQSESTSGLAS
jgi:DNA-binding NtrC family response regulator